jgi:hypothetical protein
LPSRTGNLLFRRLVLIVWQVIASAVLTGQVVVAVRLVGPCQGT